MLQFLKLGGSLITDKRHPRAAKAEVIARLMDEIRRAREDLPQMQLLIGHGSGSFGHVPAKRYGTRSGARSAEDWRGFIEVWRQARDLNNLVLEAARTASLPVIAFPPSAFIHAKGGRVHSINADPLKSALAAGLIPVVNGDVVFDHDLGGTIFSTEDVFAAIAADILPNRILLCGLETGVYRDYPHCAHLLPRIDLASADEILASIGGSSGIDVTGGMVAKVRQMLDLVRQFPDLNAVIFSGLQPENLLRALDGENPGTLICSHKQGL